MSNNRDSYWKMWWRLFRQHRIGFAALLVVGLFCIVGIYAPFLASSKPVFIIFDGEGYFPLFRYLFYTEYYTKPIDIFFNLLIFTFPLFCLIMIFQRQHRGLSLGILTLLQLGLFFYFASGSIKDPASDINLNYQYHLEIQRKTQEEVNLASISPLFAPFPQIHNWHFDMQYTNAYEKLNLVLQEQQLKDQHQRLLKYVDQNASINTLWSVNRENQEVLVKRETEFLIKNQARYKKYRLWFEFFREDCILEIGDQVETAAFNKTKPYSFSTNLNSLPSSQKGESKQLPNFSRTPPASEPHINNKCPYTRWLPSMYPSLLKMRHFMIAYDDAKAKLHYIQDRQEWIEAESKKITFQFWPLIRTFHWEDDAGGDQYLNQKVPWWELSRVNRKDLVAALIFGIRISLVVGLTSIALALAIGIPIGAAAGYYAGKTDIIVSRLLEIWEAMPVFFMLLLVVAITQSKSIFLIIAVIGFFGWTSFSRYIRGEFFKQRNLAYVEACRAQGFSNPYIIFSHILPNAIPPVLTLLPFAIMGAITSETGLAFLGLGEEGSSSWGVLMDEARLVFPGESYLLWPPAILLTVLLIAIAIVGDTMRDVLDPRK